MSRVTLHIVSWAAVNNGDGHYQVLTLRLCKHLNYPSGPQKACPSRFRELLCPDTCVLVSSEQLAAPDDRRLLEELCIPAWPPTRCTSKVLSSSKPHPLSSKGQPRWTLMCAGMCAGIYAYLCANIDRDGLCYGFERGPKCSPKQSTAASGDVLQAGRL